MSSTLLAISRAVVGVRGRLINPSHHKSPEDSNGYLGLALRQVRADLEELFCLFLKGAAAAKLTKESSSPDPYDDKSPLLLVPSPSGCSVALGLMEQSSPPATPPVPPQPSPSSPSAAPSASAKQRSYASIMWSGGLPIQSRYSSWSSSSLWRSHLLKSLRSARDAIPSHTPPGFSAQHLFVRPSSSRARHSANPK